MYRLTKVPLAKTAGGRPGTKISPKGLVIHWTANTGSGADADNNRDYFNNSGVTASAHYIVDDHQVVQCIPEEEMAYHVGANWYMPGALERLSDYPNDCTLGIEICVNQDGNFFKTMENTVALAADICKRYGWSSDNLWRHYDITGKACPKFFVDASTAAAYGFLSGNAGWKDFKEAVEKNIGEKDKTEVPKWKQEIMEQARANGLISEDHDPDELGSKWFVLAVALNLLKKIED